MSRLTWDNFREKIYELGVDHVALFVMKDNASGSSGSDIYEEGVAWNGVSSINEKREGAEPNKQWADNLQYIVLYSNEEFGLTIEAFNSPKEFDVCDGKRDLISNVLSLIGAARIDQQRRKGFALVYRTRIGNDAEDYSYGYKLHIVYNIKAQPAETNRDTLNESPEAMTKSWECTTTPVVHSIPDGNGGVLKPTAHLELDSTKVDPLVMELLENALYGTDDNHPTMLMPDEIYDYFSDQDDYYYFITSDNNVFMTSDHKYFKLVEAE